MSSASRAKKAVQRAREADRRSWPARIHADVVFTSGATEANNLAILGLAEHGRHTGRRHLVTTAIEHKAVLEPMEALAKQGFELTVVGVGPSGRVSAEDAVLAAVRDDTLLVSVMHANNETGVLQPIREIADGLGRSRRILSRGRGPRLWQGTGRAAARSDRLDGGQRSQAVRPKGRWGTDPRRRGYERPPLKPLMFGGGQERGLRPGTLPVPLIAGFGEAARLALRDCTQRRLSCENDQIRGFGRIHATQAKSHW